MALLNLFKSMHIFNKFKGTKGFAIAWQHHIRFQYMITQKTEERVRILAFWEKHGQEATKEAFGVSRRTLFRWQALLRQGAGALISLTPKKTIPKNKRVRVLPQGFEEAIITLRTAHPRLGKDKLFALLHDDYPRSVSTVGRVLKDLKKQGRLPEYTAQRLSGTAGTLTTKKPRKKAKKQRRPQGVRVLEIDTIVRYLDGIKRYTLTAIDTETRVAFAGCYTNHGSSSASDFLAKASQVIPDCPRDLQTDNGSEFALHFTKSVEQQGFNRFHTYPRSPKMNAHVERFNRTLHEEFLRYHRGLMRDNVPAFNQALTEWLLWYNTKRPHSSLGQKAPLQVMMERVNPEECQKWWTRTQT